MDSRSDESGVNSSFDASGVDQSSLEVSTLTGTSEDDERERVSSVTLIACVCCALAFIMVVVMVLLFTDLELYGDDDSGGEDTYDPHIPTRYPPGSGSGSPAAVTEALTKTPPPVPFTARRTTSRPPPPSTSPRPLTTNTTKRTTRPPRPPTPSSRRTTTRPPPPATPSPVVSTRSPTVPSRRPTPAPFTKTTTKRTTKRPPPPPPPPTRATVKTTTTKRSTKRPPPPPPPTTRATVKTSTTKRTTKRPPPPPPPPTRTTVKTTTTKRTTKRPPPPTPPPTKATVKTTTTRRTTKSPRPTQPIKSQSLLCTFGNRTKNGTKFPADGLCDYIIYDSMYKNNKNPLVGNWDQGVYSILSKAHKTDRAKTQFGLGFAFEYRRNLTRDLMKSSLEVFWEHNVFHFGILDCPGHATRQADMDEVFVALKALNDRVQTARATGNSSYIILGAVSNDDKWNDYFKSKFGSVFTPDLFISVSHQLHGDPQRSNCYATPPTIFKKPRNLHDAHDLYDATRALASIASVPGGPRLSFSVTMKGRWSQLLPSSWHSIFQACQSGTPGPYFGRLTDICNVWPFSDSYVYEPEYNSVSTYDSSSRRIFVFESEKALEEKLRLAWASISKVKFGFAVYDLDYEDTNNTCDDLNSYGAYSRLQEVSIALKKIVRRKIV